MMVCDITKHLPRFMLAADMIYTDPPWNLGNLNGYYTKAGLADYFEAFGSFADALFCRIREISPAVCYLEIGKQNARDFEARLRDLFPVVQVWEILYYRRHPCYLLRGARTETAADFTGMDDTATPLAAISSEGEAVSCVGDLCTGQGLTAVAAHKLGKRFVGTELNRRRMAVTIDRTNKLGCGYESPVS